MSVRRINISFWTMLCLTYSVTLAEVFSSVSKIKQLIEQERQLINHLELVLNISQAKGDSDQEKIERLKKKLQNLDAANTLFQEEWNYLESPIAGFKHLKRIYEDWQDVTESEHKSENKKRNFLDDNLQSMYNVTTKWRLWPSEKDVEGAALGLVRLSHVYKVFPVPEWLSDSAFCISNCSRHIGVQSNHVIVPLPVSGSSGCHQMNSKEKSNVLQTIYMFKTCRSKKPHVRWKDYELFSAHDLMFVARTALGNQQKYEARRWMQLVKTFKCRSDTVSRSLVADDNALVDLGELEKKTLNHDDPVLDSVQAGFLSLCQSSIIQFQERKEIPATSCLCFWTYSWPYVRYATETVHKSPEINVFHNVISNSEIQDLIDMALERMEPSLLPVNSKTENRTNLLRVSQTAWLYDTTEFLKRLSRRVGDITKLNSGQSDVDTPSEPFQVVNYGLGGMYAPHQDSVKVSRARGKENVPWLQHAGDRLATWMFYLSDVTSGGATVFPALNLSVTPIKGSAVFWYNLQQDGSTDSRLIHGACPVLLGNKWVANKWIRETAQTFHNPCHELRL
ncbi:prolyl 4-hydroxylase subunit alpha-1-like isoform X1 [Biomphalaria pfeifferi]|uniref:procollagen-proline 4-dioxygenase n=1 Tax=Biomphalaria pfeifferi TaxID=112525 RepID=A0AAD8BWQ9_BIOPF|nr:prolyl 4-hydroxylase subunit alpha-1-like isoform X1 [Biomphalaria pfeifferi]